MRTRRRKLAAALMEQIELIDALEAGETYRKAIVRRRQDLETDKVGAATEQRTVPAWWRVDDNGQIHFALRYGAVRLKVKDGKDTFVLPSLGALRDLLPPLRQEVLTGQLDGALADAAASLQTRFTPKKPTDKAKA